VRQQQQQQRATAAASASAVAATNSSHAMSAPGRKDCSLDDALLLILPRDLTTILSEPQQLPHTICLHVYNKRVGEAC